jgi:hypothetical protein
MKTAKITNIEKKPEFRTNDGKTLYVFELELDKRLLMTLLTGVL